MTDQGPAKISEINSNFENISFANVIILFSLDVIRRRKLNYNAKNKNGFSIAYTRLNKVV